MSNYIIHKRIDYTDRNFKVESLGEDYKPFCNCQQHFCVNHKDVDTSDKEIESVSYNFTVNLDNNLTIGFTQDCKTFNFTKFYHDQPLSGTHFIDKKLENKVLHRMNLSNKSVNLSYYDTIYSYGSTSFDIILGKHVDNTISKSLGKTLYPEGVDDNTLWIKGYAGSTMLPGSKEFITDLTGSVIIESELIRELLDISDILTAQLSSALADIDNLSLENIKDKLDKVFKNKHVKPLVEAIDAILSKNPLELGGIVDARNKVIVTMWGNVNPKKYISDGCERLIDDQYNHYRSGTKVSKCLNMMKFYDYNDYKRTFKESVENFKEIKEPNGPGSVQSYTIKPVQNIEQYLKYLVYQNFELKKFDALDNMVSYAKLEHQNNPELVILGEGMEFEGISCDGVTYDK